MLIFDIQSFNVNCPTMMTFYFKAEAALYKSNESLSIFHKPVIIPHSVQFSYPSLFEVEDDEDKEEGDTLTDELEAVDAAEEE